jgi:hypothetical protein
MLGYLHLVSNVKIQFVDDNHSPATFRKFGIVLREGSDGYYYIAHFGMDASVLNLLDSFDFTLYN